MILAHEYRTENALFIMVLVLLVLSSVTAAIST